MAITANELLKRILEATSSIKVGVWSINKTSHIKDKRVGANVSRGDGIDDGEIYRVFKKFLVSVSTPIIGKTYHIVFRRGGKGKVYTDMIISIESQLKANIVTIIQKNHTNPHSYRKSEVDDVMLVVENLEFFIVVD